MKINDKYFVTNCAGVNRSIITNLFSSDGSDITYTEVDALYAQARKILKIISTKNTKIDIVNDQISKVLMMAGITNPDDIKERLYVPAKKDVDTQLNDVVPNTFNETKAKIAIDKLIKFMSEFNFTPGYRFVNSFAISSDKAEYVRNYFAVQDHPYAADVAEKIKSAEFKDIVNQFNSCNCNPTPINTRFELYYGTPSTGKTTKANKVTNDNCIICASDMVPADLMQNFGFSDGKAEFQKSDLWIAMEEGKTITLDEINMLPFESLRFLQGLTDAKEQFNYKGFTIKIHPKFKIYGTMNLNVGGQTIPLPEPLVDRAYEIIEFKLTADMLVAALK